LLLLWHLYAWLYCFDHLLRVSQRFCVHYSHRMGLLHIPITPYYSASHVATKRGKSNEPN
jgi:hypothetical protein